MTKRKSRKQGGGPLPLEYFGVKTGNYSAASGSDVLDVKGQTIRPHIGGRVTRNRKLPHKSQRKSQRKTRGGFIPSVMEGFAFAANKYIVPLALFAGYKMINNKSTHHSKKHFFKSNRKSAKKFL